MTPYPTSVKSGLTTVALLQHPTLFSQHSSKNTVLPPAQVKTVYKQALQLPDTSTVMGVKILYRCFPQNGN